MLLKVGTAVYKHAQLSSLSAGKWDQEITDLTPGRAGNILQIALWCRRSATAHRKLQAGLTITQSDPFYTYTFACQTKHLCDTSYNTCMLCLSISSTNLTVLAEILSPSSRPREKLGHKIQGYTAVIRTSSQRAVLYVVTNISQKFAASFLRVECKSVYGLHAVVIRGCETTLINRQTTRRHIQ
jgi:hypothetical protein